MLSFTFYSRSSIHYSCAEPSISSGGETNQMPHHPLLMCKESEVMRRDLNIPRHFKKNLQNLLGKPPERERVWWWGEERQPLLAGFQAQTPASVLTAAALHSLSTLQPMSAHTRACSQRGSLMELWFLFLCESYIGHQWLKGGEYLSRQTISQLGLMCSKLSLPE